MKQLSYILMTTGGMMTLFGAMCEANGTAYDLLIAGIAVGLALLVTGMQMYKLAVKREQERRKAWIPGKGSSVKNAKRKNRRNGCVRKH